LHRELFVQQLKHPAQLLPLSLDKLYLVLVLLRELQELSLLLLHLGQFVLVPFLLRAAL
jgi:hypothetical protein